MQRRKYKAASRFFLSRRATALPVSFLMIFASLTLIVSATYFVSVAKIRARGQLLNIAMAKQNMLSFENSIDFTAWSPGTSSLYRFEDTGGKLTTAPAAKRLLVNITDNDAFSATVFNSSIGEAAYELPPSEATASTFYLKGDRRAIINITAFTTAQLCLAPATPSPNMTLTYRPLATISETGFYQGKPVNILRLYITNLNTSDTITAQGKFSIKSTCTSVTSDLRTYNFSNPLSSISVRANLDGRTDAVALPTSSNSNGAFIKVMTLVCNVRLERVPEGS